tara:strand:- start:119 stop:1282 length:1164 start_codon:yes stop_codon:yes gene_type:complete
MRALIYIILLILIYGYIAGYFLKNHKDYQYLESEVASFNFRYISMIVLNLLVGYLYYTNLLENNDNKISIYYSVIFIGLMFIFLTRYYSEFTYVNEIAKSILPLLLVIFIIIYISNDILEDQAVGIKLIVAVLFIYCLTVLLTRNPSPFELESIKNMDKISGLITLIPSDEIVQLATNKKDIETSYKLDYNNLDSFALSFSIYIESSGLKSISSDVSYDIIKLQTTDTSENKDNNINFTINYHYAEKNLVLKIVDSSFNNYITNNNDISNNYIIPIKFNSNNLYKWHHILLNFTKTGIDIYSNNISFTNVQVLIDPTSNEIRNFNNYDNKLIKEIKFINPTNYLDYKFNNISIGNTNNLGNDYISLSKMIFYSREIKSDELDKINNL